VTRAQMAVFLLRGEHGGTYHPPAASGAVFADVPAGSFAADWIERLAAEGITTGCGGGRFCPNDPVTRTQMAIFLLRAKHGSGFHPPAAEGLFADVPAGTPFADWVEELALEGIAQGCGGGNDCPGAAVTRGAMEAFLARAFGL